MTTQRIVSVEITSTAEKDRGIGAQPDAIKGIIPQSRQTMERLNPNRARNPAHPVKASSSDATSATKAATDGMR